MQKGLTHRFEVFKTLDKGWGVRSLRVIQKGSFVCEYVGEIITDAEADKRDDDSFVFDLESRVCRNSVRSKSQLKKFMINNLILGYRLILH